MIGRIIVAVLWVVVCVFSFALLISVIGVGYSHAFKYIFSNLLQLNEYTAYPVVVTSTALSTFVTALLVLAVLFVTLLTEHSTSGGKKK